MKDAIIEIKRGIDGSAGAKLIDCAWRFKSKVYVQKDGRRVSAQSLMSVLSLQLTAGDEIQLIADGPDEEEAICMLEKAFNTNFMNQDIIAEIKNQSKNHC